MTLTILLIILIAELFLYTINSPIVTLTPSTKVGINIVTRVLVIIFIILLYKNIL